MNEFIPAFAAGLGGEISGNSLSFGVMKPYAGVAVRTHAFVFPTSAFGLARTRWGYALHLSSGVEFLPWKSRTLGLDVGVQTDIGRLDGAQLQAWGLQGGVRWNF